MLLCSDYIPYGMNDSLRSNGTFQLWQLWNCDRLKHNQNQSYYRNRLGLSHTLFQATTRETYHANVYYDNDTNKTEIAEEKQEKKN